MTAIIVDNPDAGTGQRKTGQNGKTILAGSSRLSVMAHA